MTSNIKIISEIANGYGPQEFLVTLGHASWTAGQLEHEIKNNVWLTLPFQHDLIFNDNIDTIWGSCYTRLGISTAQISTTYGHA